MKLFERCIKLKVGETNIIGLDIAFEINKNLKSEANTCEVKILNLSLKNREILSSYKRVPVILEAGYKDFLQPIFVGDMCNIFCQKEGPDITTILSVGDGLNKIQTSRIKKTYAKDTPVKDVVQDLAKSLKLPLNSPLNQLKTMLTKGLSLSGNSMLELERLLKSQKFSVSVQDNSLQVLKHGESLVKEAIVLNTNSGLISSPEFNQNNLLTLKCLLMPELKPGLSLYIDSLIFKGLTIIQSVKFEGSTYDENWFSEVEARVV